MTEDRTKQWMQAVAGAAQPGVPGEAERIWMAAQLDRVFEPRRQWSAFQLRVDAAIQCAIALAIAAVSMCAFGMAT